MAKKRTFHGTMRGRPFAVETTLTDAEAIKRLRKQTGDFALDCAKAIHDASGGFDVSENKVAWGFRMAEEQAITRKIHIHKSILSLVGPRKPRTYETDAGPLRLSFCGERSKYHGQYTVTNGGVFGSPEARFYGRATPNGEIEITAPEPVIALLENGE